MERVVQTVTIEGPARARLKLDLPIRQLGKFDRLAGSFDQAGSNWHLVWWPQRDSNPCFSLERATS